MKSKLTLFILFLASFNATAQWTIIDTITGANYMTMHFFSADTGIIGGQMNGKFIKTTNGGATWDTILAPTNSQIFEMQFVNNNTGYACGGSGFSTIHNILIRTNDRGNTWDTVILNYFPLDGEEYMGISFKSIDTGIIYGTSNLYKTVNGGMAITSLNKPTSTFQVQHAALLHDNSIIVTGVDFSTGFVNELCRSADWGAHWTTLYSDNTVNVAALAFNGTNGIAACSNGWVLRTSNTGVSWTPAHIASDSMNFFRVCYGPAGYVYMSAIKNYDGYLYTSTNGGAGFHPGLLVSPSYAIWGISMPVTTTGYLISNRQIYKTTNGGGMLGLANTPNSAGQVTVYPNPSHGTLHVEAAGGQLISAIEVYDITGKLVKVAAKGNTDVSISGISPGTYFVRIQISGESVIKKVQVD